MARLTNSRPEARPQLAAHPSILWVHSVERPFEAGLEALASVKVIDAGALRLTVEYFQSFTGAFVRWAVLFVQRTLGDHPPALWRT